MMDSGELEFHNHNEQCTGRCISRNAGVSKYDITKFDNEMDLPTFVPLVTSVSSLTPKPVFGGMGAETTTEGVSVQVAVSQPVFPTATLVSHSSPTVPPSHSSQNSPSKPKDKHITQEKMTDLSTLVPTLVSSLNNGIDLLSSGSALGLTSQSVFPVNGSVTMTPVSPNTAHTVNSAIIQEVNSDPEHRDTAKQTPHTNGQEEINIKEERIELIENLADVDLLEGK